MKQFIFFSIILLFLSSIINNEKVLAFESIDAVIGQRIIGGEDADIMACPYLASLRRGGEYFCAASSVREDGLLTAAHCFTHTPRVIWPYLDVSVHMGTSNLQELGSVFRILKAIIHPGWTGKGIKRHDIVFIKLENNITFNQYQNKLKLPVRNVINNKWGWMNSWGSKTPYSQIMSQRLQRVRMTVFNYLQCRQKLPPSLVLQEDQLCTYLEGVRGCAEGDVGAPLVIFNRIVAIHSWTVGACQAFGLPEVFVDVFAERHFINGAMKPE